MSSFLTGSVRDEHPLPFHTDGNSRQERTADRNEQQTGTNSGGNRILSLCPASFQPEKLRPLSGCVPPPGIPGGSLRLQSAVLPAE